MNFRDQDSTYVIAELGVNHLGSIHIAKKLIEAAADAGCQAVKTQALNPERVYTAEELGKPRIGPWGRTYGDGKGMVYLPQSVHEQLREYAWIKGLHYALSPWDMVSLELAKKLELDWIKVPSPRLGHEDLVRGIGQTGLPVVMSTAMSYMHEVKRAANWCRPDVILFCLGEYPEGSVRAERRELIKSFAKERDALFGYSGHERGVYRTLDAVANGARVVERHIVLVRDHTPGSDTAASLEPDELKRLVDDIRRIERDRALVEPSPIDPAPGEMPHRARIWREKDL